MTTTQFNTFFRLTAEDSDDESNIYTIGNFTSLAVGKLAATADYVENNALNEKEDLPLEWKEGDVEYYAELEGTIYKLSVESLNTEEG